MTTPTRAVLTVTAVLAVLHHDLWFWDDPSLVGGVLPTGLAWHAGFSLVCGAAFFALGRLAWPGDPLGEDAP